MVAQDDLKSPSRTHPHVDHSTGVGFSAGVEVVPGTADDAYCSSLRLEGIVLSLAHHSSFAGFDNRRAYDPSDEAGQKNCFGCLDWSTSTSLRSPSPRYWYSSFRRTVDAHVVKEEIFVAEADSSVFPCSCGRIENAGDGEDLDSGNTLHHLGSGCIRSEACCSIHFEHVQVVAVRLVNVMSSDCRNSYCDEIGHQSCCVARLRKLAMPMNLNMQVRTLSLV